MTPEPSKRWRSRLKPARMPPEGEPRQILITFFVEVVNDPLSEPGLAPVFAHRLGPDINGAIALIIPLPMDVDMEDRLPGIVITPHVQHSVEWTLFEHVFAEIVRVHISQRLLFFCVIICPDDERVGLVCGAHSA